MLNATNYIYFLNRPTTDSLNELYFAPFSTLYSCITSIIVKPHARAASGTNIAQSTPVDFSMIGYNIKLNNGIQANLITNVNDETREVEFFIE